MLCAVAAATGCPARVSNERKRFAGGLSAAVLWAALRAGHQPRRLHQGKVVFVGPFRRRKKSM